MPDARHLVETDAVDLLRAHVGGGRLLDQRLVQGRTVLHRDQPRRAVAAGGEVFRPDELLQLAVGPEDALADHGAVGARQALPVGGGEIRRQVPDRLVERAGLGAARHLQLELVEDVFHHQLRLGVSGGHALAHANDGAFEVLRVAVQALEAVVVVLHRPERRGGLARGDFGVEHVRTAEVVDGQLRLDRNDAALVEVEQLAALVAEHVVGDAILARERGAVDRVEASHLVLGVRPHARVVLGRDVVPELVGITQVTAHHGAHGAQRQRRLVAVGEDLPQRGCVVCPGIGQGAGSAEHQRERSSRRGAPIAKSA